MLCRVLAAKLHRARVTDANLNYVGSVTIDRDLMDAAGIYPYEVVQISNVATGVAWQTYVIEGPRGQGDLCLNGPPARLFQPGDLVIVLAWRWLTVSELAQHRPRLVFVDEANRVTAVRTATELLEAGSPVPYPATQSESGSS
jgi:aspartate 1-decarboxylase